MLVVFIVYAPTNSGLKFIREEGLKKLAGLGIDNFLLVEERGEKIPERINSLAEEPEAVIGIDGADLFADFNFSTNGNSKLCYLNNLKLKFKGPYANSIFGLPTLTILGRDGKSPEEMAAEFKKNPSKNYYECLNALKGKKVIIPARYKHLLRKYIPEETEISTNDRSVDVKFSEDRSLDYAIDIVLRGDKCKALHIGVLAPIFESDGVLTANETGQNLYLNKKVASLGFASYNDFIVWFNTGREQRQYYGECYHGIH